MSKRPAAKKRKTRSQAAGKEVVKSKSSSRSAVMRKPPRGKRGEDIRRDEEGPLGWLMPEIESAYTQFAARDGQTGEAHADAVSVTSRLEPRRKVALTKAHPMVWKELLQT